MKKKSNNYADGLAGVRCPNALEYFERKLNQKRAHIRAEEERCAWMEIIIKELKSDKE